MANGQMLYSDISAFVNVVYEAALEVAMAENVMANLVLTFTDLPGQMTPRTTTIWGEGGLFRQILETDDISPTTIARTAGQTLTPYEYGDRHDVTYTRLDADPEGAAAYAARDLGRKAAETVDRHLIGDFPSLTGGTIGAAGTVITWRHIFAARAQMQAAKLRGPFVAVLHPYQIFVLQESQSIARLTMNAVPQASDYNAPFQVYQVGDIIIIGTYNIDVNGQGDARGAMFSRDALALDLREAFVIRPDDDPSARHIELNATMKYAHGVWRPDYGWQLLFDAATPTGA